MDSLKKVKLDEESRVILIKLRFSLNSKMTKAKFSNNNLTYPWTLQF